VPPRFSIASDPLLYLSMNQGVGAGVIFSDRLLTGRRGFAGEVGHMVLHINGPMCSCGRRGCAEALIGPRSILGAPEDHPHPLREIRRLRNHGSEKRSCHSMGFNSRLDDIHAGVLSAKLKCIDGWNDLRRKWSARYSACLKDARHITLPFEAPGHRHIFHLYVIETLRAEHRDPFLKFLNDNGVDAKCHYPIAIHQQQGYPWGKQARIAGPIPNAERNAACCISLPMFPELTAEEVDYVIEKVLEWDRAAA